MNKVFLHKSFLDDIESSRDNAFVRRAFLNLVSELNGTPNQLKDHRYKGINDAWIRHLTGGNTAYRLIFIRVGAKIIYYRCGGKDIEEHLSAPDLSADKLVELELDDTEVEEMTLPKTFLSNHTQKLTLTALVGRRLIPNREAWIVSPFLSEEILRRGSTLGILLDSLVRDGTSVTLITALDQVNQHAKIFNDLSARNIDFVFVEGLHSKIYLFVTDESYAHKAAQTPSLGIIGSSNLTNSGIASMRGQGNVETNYTVPTESISELEELVQNFYINSLDYFKAAKKFKNMGGH